MTAAPSTPAWPRYWIFQADPDQYDLKRNLAVGEHYPWSASRFVNQYRPGDIVYLWTAGKDSGIVAWAEVAGEVYRDKMGTARVEILCRERLNETITRERLRKAGKTFDGLTILRNPAGTNFRVTALEAMAINRLIAEQPRRPAPEPLQLEDPNRPGQHFISAHYLLDYRYSHPMRQLLSASLEHSRSLNGTFFPKLLIQMAIAYSETLLAEHPSLERSTPLPEAFLAWLHELSSQLPFAESARFSGAPPLSPRLTDGQRCGVKTLQILAEARRFAIKTTRKEEIALRHLIGAILQGVTESIQRYVEELLRNASGPDLATARAQYVEAITRQWPNDLADSWQKLISEELSATDHSEPVPPLLTVIDSDAVDGQTRDALGIDNEAVAIAKLLCAVDAAPPIAIGLFGEWGSGKTFFMRRIRQHVKKLSDYSSQSSDRYSDIYCQKVAQIWFNAWNYEDSDLWASLVNHMFAGLRQELKRLNEADEKFLALIRELDSERENEARLSAASKRLKQLDQERQQTENRIRILKQTIESIEKKSTQSGNATQLIETLETHQQDIGALLGTEPAQQLRQLATDIHGLCRFIDNLLLQPNPASRIRQWLRVFSNSWKSWPQYAITLTAAAAALTLLWATGTDRTDLAAWLGGGLAPLLGSLLQPLHKMHKTTTLLRNLKAELEQHQTAHEQQREQQLAAHKRQLQALKLQQAEQEAERSVTDQEYRQLLGRYGQPDAETFANFIFDRAESTEYTRKLGLLSTIRRDFSRLNELLAGQRHDSQLPKLDRIILYIDDLDRCEPDKVVKVLQAIHLMLAFPLFMVVVGVDARWVGRCLKERYPFLIHEKNDTGDENRLDPSAASTHDYLEKIFQIPFWLKPIDGDKATQMIDTLLQRDRLSLTRPPAPLTAPPGENQQPRPEETAELFSESEDQEAGYSETASDAESIDSNLISTRAMSMSPAELEYIKRLGTLVGRSPRAVKRFINLYRILKSSNPGARIAGFADPQGDFRTPLLLLAIICGHPKSAEALFLRLRACPGEQSLSQALATIHDEHDISNWQGLYQPLIQFAQGEPSLQVAQLNRWIPDTTRFSYREWLGG